MEVNRNILIQVVVGVVASLYICGLVITENAHMKVWKGLVGSEVEWEGHRILLGEELVWLPGFGEELVVVELGDERNRADSSLLLSKSGAVEYEEHLGLIEEYCSNPGCIYFKRGRGLMCGTPVRYFIVSGVKISGWRELVVVIKLEGEHQVIEYNGAVESWGMFKGAIISFLRGRDDEMGGDCALDALSWPQITQIKGAD